MRQDKLLFGFGGADENVISFAAYNRRGSDNSSQRELMKRVLKRAITGELTEMQRRCLTEFYLGGKTQTQIAREMGLNRSTVCRHIAAAHRKLRKVASYYSGS